MEQTEGEIDRPACPGCDTEMVPIPHRGGWYCPNDDCRRGNCVEDVEAWDHYRGDRA